MSEYRRCREGQVYLFTVVTHRHRAILTTDLGRRLLREAMRTTSQSRPFKTIAVVLLPDHLHAIWELPASETDYSTRWRHIKTLFTSSWTAATGSSGTESKSRQKRNEQDLWQRRFFEHTCRDEADLKRCVDYVHVNPLKHGLVKRVRLAMLLVASLCAAWRIFRRLGQLRGLVR